MPASASTRYLETEFEDAQLRADYGRQRQLSKRKPPSITIGSKQLTLSIIIYSFFPALALMDFALGLLAKSQRWYPRCLGEIICDWSGAACAVWIASALSAIGVGVCALLGKIVNSAYECWTKRRNRERHKEQDNEQHVSDHKIEADLSVIP